MSENQSMTMEDINNALKTILAQRERIMELEAKLAKPVVNQELTTQANAQDGWVLVPINPTEVMQDAGVPHMGHSDACPFDAGATYSAMLAAVTAPAAAQEEKHPDPCINPEACNAQGCANPGGRCGEAVPDRHTSTLTNDRAREILNDMMSHMEKWEEEFNGEPSEEECSGEVVRFILDAAKGGTK